MQESTLVGRSTTSGPPSYSPIRSGVLRIGREVPVTQVIERFAPGPRTAYAARGLNAEETPSAQQRDAGAISDRWPRIGALGLGQALPKNAEGNGLDRTPGSSSCPFLGSLFAGGSPCAEPTPRPVTREPPHYAGHPESGVSRSGFTWVISFWTSVAGNPVELEHRDS